MTSFPFPVLCLSSSLPLHFPKPKGWNGQCLVITPPLSLPFSTFSALSCGVPEQLIFVPVPQIKFPGGWEFENKAQWLSSRAEWRTSAKARFYMHLVWDTTKYLSYPKYIAWDSLYEVSKWKYLNFRLEDNIFILAWLTHYKLGIIKKRCFTGEKRSKAMS